MSALDRLTEAYTRHEAHIDVLQQEILDQHLNWHRTVVNFVDSGQVRVGELATRLGVSRETVRLWCISGRRK